jgi:hypothetical protein
MRLEKTVRFYKPGPRQMEDLIQAAYATGTVARALPQAAFCQAVSVQRSLRMAVQSIQYVIVNCVKSAAFRLAAALRHAKSRTYVAQKEQRVVDPFFPGIPWQLQWSVAGRV